MQLCVIVAATLNKGVELRLMSKGVKNYQDILSKYGASKSNNQAPHQRVLKRARVEGNKKILSCQQAAQVLNCILSMADKSSLDSQHLDTAFGLLLNMAKRQAKDIDSISKTLCAIDRKAKQMEMSYTLNSYHKLLSFYGLAKDEFNILRFWKELIASDQELTVQSFSIYINSLKKIYRYEDAANAYQRFLCLQLAPDLALLNTMIGIYGKLGDFANIAYILEAIEKNAFEKSAYTYNSLINAYAKYGNISSCLYYFEEFKRSDLTIDSSTYRIVIGMFIKESLIDEAHVILNDMMDHGIQMDHDTWHQFLSYYCDKKDIEKIKEVLAAMSAGGLRLNLKSYTILMNYYCKDENSEKIRSLLSQMEKAGVSPDNYIYNAIITMYKRQRQCNKALALFSQIERSKQIVPDVAMYCNVMEIATLDGNGQLCESLYQKAVAWFNSGYERARLTNSYLDHTYYMYLKDGKLALWFQQYSDLYTKRLESRYRPVDGSIDCHGMSPGAFAMMLCHFHQNNMLTQHRFNVGCQKHSKGNNDHRLESVPEKLEELLKDANYVWKKEGKVLVCSIASTKYTYTDHE